LAEEDLGRKGELLSLPSKNDIDLGEEDNSE